MSCTHHFITSAFARASRVTRAVHAATRAAVHKNGVRAAIALGVTSAAVALPLRAQTPAPTAPPPYHAPVLVLSEPADGDALPADKPVAVFRFVAGETSDPVDALSFSVTVDGADRTALFQLVTSVVNGITSGEAWGTIDEVGTTASGPHDVRARICSMRGTCAVAHASLSIVAPEQPVVVTPNAAGVVPAASRGTTSTATAKKRGRSIMGVLDKVLQAVHVLAR